MNGKLLIIEGEITEHADGRVSGRISQLELELSDPDAIGSRLLERIRGGSAAALLGDVTPTGKRRRKPRK